MIGDDDDPCLRKTGGIQPKLHSRSDRLVRHDDERRRLRQLLQEIAVNVCQRISLPGDWRFTSVSGDREEQLAEVAVSARYELRVLRPRFQDYAALRRSPRDGLGGHVALGSADKSRHLWIVSFGDGCGHRCPYAEAGRCALRKERIWRTARGIRSVGSFHGNILTSDFGASMAASMATAYG